MAHLLLDGGLFYENERSLLVPLKSRVVQHLLFMRLQVQTGIFLRPQAAARLTAAFGTVGCVPANTPQLKASQSLLFSVPPSKCNAHLWVVGSGNLAILFRLRFAGV